MCGKKRAVIEFLVAEKESVTNVADGFAVFMKGV
jgi:hypothetical protein